MHFKLRKYLEGLISLVYPKLCLVCGSTLMGNEGVICTFCRNSLPLTNFHKSKGNPVEQLFWGRLPVENATALLFFDKGSTYRNLIHQLKYNGRKDSGLFLGKLLGSVLQESPFKSIDCIVPVPLHRAKLRRRGFNQSHVIATGMSEIMGKRVYPDILRRKMYTPSQTLRKRYERWENVEGVFECIHPEKIMKKHVLLVDDVITTGATTEAAGSVLCEIEGTRISIAATAIAHV
jgi:ComF family protein